MGLRRQLSDSLQPDARYVKMLLGLTFNRVKREVEMGNQWLEKAAENLPQTSPKRTVTPSVRYCHGDAALDTLVAVVRGLLGKMHGRK